MRVGSTANPRDWANSRKATFRRDLYVIAEYPGTNSVDRQNAKPGIAPQSWLGMSTPLNSPAKTVDGHRRAPTGTDEYLNIWVCGDLRSSNQQILDYAQFPGGRPETDGVVIANTCFGTTGTVTRPETSRKDCGARDRPLAEHAPHLGRRRSRLLRRHGDEHRNIGAMHNLTRDHSSTCRE